MSDYKKRLVPDTGHQLKELNARLDGHLSFSFEFLQEREFFGVGDCDNQWFKSLLEAITRYSSLKLSDIRGRHPYRYHAIDWNHKNIPIKFEDLDWLPKNEQFLVGPDEIYQLSIATGLGRIVGFSLGNTFYVVLLDPKHNLQPSHEYNYLVTPTTISETEYEEIKRKYDLLYQWTRGNLSETQLKKLELSGPQMYCIYANLSASDYEVFCNYCSNSTIHDWIYSYACGQIEIKNKSN